MDLLMDFLAAFESGNDYECCPHFERLIEIQGELNKVNEEACDKILEIVQKYNEKRRPVYAKRNEIIKSIPDFWLTTFLNHPVLADLLTEEDQKIFKYIDTLKVDDFIDVKLGFFITFEFKQNPYFENTKLSKTFAFCEGGMKVMGTNIKWKEGMGSATGVDHGEKGNKRPAPNESFFNWFTDTQPMIFDEVLEAIKEDLWPNPLECYYNITVLSEDEDNDDEEE